MIFTDTNVSLGALSDLAGLSNPPDAMSEFYGTSACVAPTVSTSTSTSVGSSSFRANGNLGNLGGSGCNQTDHGFYVGTSTNYASNTKHSLGTKTSTGNFHKTITGLSSSTTYRVFAYSENGAGETIGNMVTTSTALPGISIYLAGNWTANPIDGVYACGGTTSGPHAFNGDCTAPYGACSSCTSGGGVIGYGTITTLTPCQRQ